MRPLVDRNHVFLARVVLRQCRRNRDLPSRLVEIELQRIRGRSLAALGEDGLCGGVEGVPNGLLDPVEIRDPRLRPGVSLERRVVVLIRIRVEAELVHQRLRTLARAVGGAEIVDEADRRR